MAAPVSNVVVIGGHGKVALRLTRLLTSRPNTKVTSIIRGTDHKSQVEAAGATPLFLSLEASTVKDFANAFKDTQADVVYFTAGSGGVGGLERLESVDVQGAIKVFDAIDSLEGNAKKPRLILLSSLDVRDASKPHPAHYTAEDIEISGRNREIIAPYLDAKYRADKNLAGRSSFKWTIMRPNWYTDEQGTGKAHVGRAHLKNHITRDDVAKVLYLLLEREDAHGLTIDVAGGDESIEAGLEGFIKRGETDFVV